MTEKKKNGSGGKTRREFLKDAGLLIGGTAIGSTVLLAACGGTETLTNTVTRTNTSTVTSTAPGATQTVTSTTTVGAGETATVTQTTTATESRFVCPTCGAEFETLVELQTHFANVHGEMPTAADLNVINLIINGIEREIQVKPQWTLAFLIREKLGLTGTKIACDRGACGACTIIVDGELCLSCMKLAIECGGTDILTIEGLETNGELDPLQVAFVEHDAMQCGFCVPGTIMAAKNLLQKNTNPTKEEVMKGLSGVLCRCGAYQKMIEAVMGVS